MFCWRPLEMLVSPTLFSCSLLHLQEDDAINLHRLTPHTYEQKLQGSSVYLMEAEGIKQRCFCVISKNCGNLNMKNKDQTATQTKTST